MTSLIPYIVFPGTCKEALEFYAKALKGDIVSITNYKDSPIDVPNELGQRIFDSEFVAGSIRFKASDDLPNYPIYVGSNISLFVSFSDPEIRESTFQNLGEGGKIQFPLDESFGMLKDKYGIQWMFVLDS